MLCFLISAHHNILEGNATLVVSTLRSQISWTTINKPSVFVGFHNNPEESVLAYYHIPL